MDTQTSPLYTPFFGVMGAVSAVVFCALGAAYGTAKAGAGICSMGVMRPELIIKSIIPVVMAGIVGIYGLVLQYSWYNSWMLQKIWTSPSTSSVLD